MSSKILDALPTTVCFREYFKSDFIIKPKSQTPCPNPLSSPHASNAALQVLIRAATPVCIFAKKLLSAYLEMREAFIKEFFGDKCHTGSDPVLGLKLRVKSKVKVKRVQIASFRPQNCISYQKVNWVTIGSQRYPLDLQRSQNKLTTACFRMKNQMNHPVKEN